MKVRLTRPFPIESNISSIIDEVLLDVRGLRTTRSTVKQKSRIVITAE
jgi:hypothetical protein